MTANATATASTAEDLLAEDDRERDREGEHPQGDVHGDDEGDEETGHEVSFAHFLAADLAAGELDAQAYDVGDEVEREHPKETVPPVPEDVEAGVTHREAVLVADVPHAEEGGRDGGDHHEDEDAFEIDGVTYVGTLAGDGPGHVQEGLESIDR